MNNHQILIAFVWDRAASEPNEKRIQIYRGLAAICGDQDEERQLNQLADSLDRAEQLCRQFKFSFVQ